MTTPSSLELALAGKRRELHHEMFRHAARVGKIFVEYCLEIALARCLEQPGFDPKEVLHEACRMRWPYTGVRGFRSSSLATLEDRGRTFIAQSRDDAAVAAATLWYMLAHNQEPTGHDLFNLIEAWQSDVA